MKETKYEKAPDHGRDAWTMPGSMREVISPVPFYESDSSPMRTLFVGEMIMIIKCENRINCKLITSTGVVGYVYAPSLKACTRPVTTLRPREDQ